MISTNNKVLAVVGPTASGKTALGVALAQRFNGEVVSFDSMQLYRRMDIGTAKPTADEMQGIPHHMIDVAEPEENWSVARYVQEAVPVVEDILSRGKLPVLVGGTGLYLDSLVSGRTFAVQSVGWRDRLQERVRQEGILPLLDELSAVDPIAAAKLHPADEKRIIRALEVWHETGKTITQHDAETKLIPPRYDTVTIGLNFTDRTDLHKRIARRVDEMVTQGLYDEIRSLLASGVPENCTAMQAIGYKEIVAAMHAGTSLDAAAEEVKLRTRQYAKRQLTWFRRKPDTNWYFWSSNPDFQELVQFATEKAQLNGIR